MEKFKNELREDALPQQLVPDPSNPPDVVIYSGYLGKSTRDGYWRLYLNATMDNYIEVAETDISYSESLESRENPLGGTILWVKKDAKIIHTQTQNANAQASFLSGDITSRMLPGAIGGIDTARVVAATPITTPIATILATVAICTPITASLVIMCTGGTWVRCPDGPLFSRPGGVCKSTLGPC